MLADVGSPLKVEKDVGNGFFDHADRCVTYLMFDRRLLPLILNYRIYLKGKKQHELMPNFRSTVIFS